MLKLCIAFAALTVVATPVLTYAGSVQPKPSQTTSTTSPTPSIGSQSSGAGAGKVTFNPFSITRKIDMASPVLFQNAASGAPSSTTK